MKVMDILTQLQVVHTLIEPLCSFTLCKINMYGFVYSTMPPCSTRILSIQRTYEISGRQNIRANVKIALSGHTFVSFLLNKFPYIPYLQMDECLLLIENLSISVDSLHCQCSEIFFD